MPRHAALLLLGLLCAIPGSARSQSLAPLLPAARSAGGDLTGTALEAARRAAAAGRPAEARQHALRALTHSPGSPEVLAELLLLACEDEDARTLWAHAWAAAAADSRGRFRPADSLRHLEVLEDQHLRRVVRTRAAAARELAGLVRDLRPRARGHEEDALVARWATVLAWELMRAAPALLEHHAAIFAAANEPFVPETGPIVAALKELMDAASGGARLSEALRIARCLNGLLSQAAFKDVKGPEPPSSARLRVAAGAHLRRLRKRLAEARDGEPPTLQELEALGTAEREAFNRTHATMGNPGVCLSPGGLYRIESHCGIATVIGAARTVERHHRRLARWLGEDPFQDRQGIVRIVPDGAGLEREGAPYWWAAGFQSGDVTSVRFACSTIEGLGRLLTHELTHRFDGVLLPGLPAWLSEGRAVWTGAAYGHSSDRGFLEDHVLPGTIDRAYIKGYGRPERLAELIEGDLEDYRDNYVAGYALYVYLDTWPPGGEPLFHGRLQAYMKHFKDGRPATVAGFKRFFADGRAGRPEGLAAFAEGFHAFLKGFHWRSRAPWTASYALKLPSRPQADPLVDDPQTWIWSRNRAEPWFGQAQADLAGRLLVDGGRPGRAVTAYCWALRVDPWSPALAREAAGLLADEGRRAGAWVVRAEASRLFPGRVAQPGEHPPFLDALPRTREHLESLQGAADAARKVGRSLAAAALAATHDRLARLLALPPLDADAGMAGLEKLEHPFNTPAFRLGAWGWEESGLTSYEERRVRGLWFVPEAGGLHVGRRSPRKGTTGSRDRRAHQRDAYARSKLWIPRGRWRLTARIQPTTSYVSGAVVLGHARRDRNVRVHFSAGDFLYAVGVREEEARRLDAVRCRLGGLYPRDRALPGSLSGRHVRFPRPVTGFRMELLVDGATVHAYVEDHFVGTYTTPARSPVEGFVGFASGHGAYVVQDPVVQLLDRHPTAGLQRPIPPPVDPAVPQDVRPGRLRNRLVKGLPVGERGTLVAWLPPLPALDGSRTFDPGRTATYAKRMPRALKHLVRKTGLRHPCVLVVPEGLSEEAYAEVQAAVVRSELGLQVVRHRWPAHVEPESQDPRRRHPRPRLMFADPHGILRVVQRFVPGRPALHASMRRWLRIFRVPETRGSDGGGG